MFAKFRSEEELDFIESQ